MEWQAARPADRRYRVVCIPQACPNTPKTLPRRFWISQMAQPLAVCGQSENFGPIGLKQRPTVALCWTFSGSDDL